MNYRTILAVILALCLGLLTACSGGSQMGESLSYEQIKGSGLANLCPQVSENRRDAIAIIPSQSYSIKELCLQPKAFMVRQDLMAKRQGINQSTQFIPAKPVTRDSFSIDQVSGVLQANSNGHLTFKEQSGFDFQPITVQLPDGERVPLLFSVKGLVAETPQEMQSINPSTQFSGTFQVPAYRTAGFLDSKGRGVTVGYDSAVGLPPKADSEEFQRSNNKVFEVRQGNLTLNVERVDQNTGEIAGSFESIQPADTDFGAKESMDVKIQGVFYSRLESETV